MSAGEADLNFEKLDRYLSSTLGVDRVETTIEADGLNLIIRIESAGDSYMLRRPTKLRQTDLFADLSVEFQVLDRLQSTSVEAPEPILLCEDTSILGEAFFLISEIHGQSNPWGTDIPAASGRHEGEGRHVGEILIDGLADIHLLDPALFEGTCEHVTLGEQLDRAESRLDYVSHVVGHDYPKLREVGDRLKEQALPERTTLVHGDYKADNVFFTDGPNPGIAGVVDWETVMRSDPRIDLAYLLLLWRDGTDTTPSLSEIRDQAQNKEVATYIEDVQRGAFWPFTFREKSPNRRELLDRYVEATGLSFDDDRYFRAFAAYMLAFVWADLHRYEVEESENPDEPGYVTGMALIAEGILDGPSIST